MHRLLVSAAHKSSGKTTLSIGLGAALHRRGLAVQAFKKGPDYNDPLWLTAAVGRRCRYLDLCLSLLERYADRLPNHFVVVTEASVRIRANLPSS